MLTPNYITVIFTFLSLQIGVDLVDIAARSGNVHSFDQYLAFFEKCFSQEEVDTIMRLASIPYSNDDC